MAERVHPAEEQPLFISPASAPPVSADAAPPVPPHQVLNQRDQFIYKVPNNATYSTVPVPPPRRRRSPCCCCLTCLCAGLIAVIAILGIAVLVFYLVVHPRLPKYSIQSAQIKTFNLTPASQNLDSDVVFTVRARNPNKKIGIYYDDIDVTLYYDDESIGYGSIPAFYQGHKNTTMLEVDIQGENTTLDSDAVQTLKSSIDDNSSIFLYARTRARIRIKIGSWKSRHIKVTVKCTVQVRAPSSTSSSKLLSESCKFRL
eukprot:c25604_g1_i2 orf=225-998(-)